VHLITSKANPLVRQARALRQRKARAETGLFLVEGIHHVGEALQSGWPLEAILFAPERLTSAFARGVLANAERLPVRIEAVSEPVMESLAEKDNPQGILAIARQKLWSLESIQPFERGAALFSPQDPGNVGSILRTLDAVGAGPLFLLEGGVDPYHPTCIRASMGAVFWRPVVQVSFDEFKRWSRDGGYTLIGSSVHGTKDYREGKIELPWVLLLGNEQKGLDAEMIAACDVLVSIPMHGRASSLNLAVAAGILLYRLGGGK
jgi:TrmH family RNA methyltransferase